MTTHKTNIIDLQLHPLNVSRLLFGAAGIKPPPAHEVMQMSFWDQLIGVAQAQQRARAVAGIPEPTYSPLHPEDGHLAQELINEIDLVHRAAIALAGGLKPTIDKALALIKDNPDCGGDPRVVALLDAALRAMSYITGHNMMLAPPTSMDDARLRALEMIRSLLDIELTPAEQSDLTHDDVLPARVVAIHEAIHCALAEDGAGGIPNDRLYPRSVIGLDTTVAGGVVTLTLPDLHANGD